MRHVHHLTWINAYWAVWLLAFLGPEVYWALTAPWNTLSDSYWMVEGLNRVHPFDLGLWSPVHWLLALLVWSLFCWLSWHLPFGLFG